MNIQDRQAGIFLLDRSDQKQLTLPDRKLVLLLNQAIPFHQGLQSVLQLLELL